MNSNNGVHSFLKVGWVAERNPPFFYILHPIPFALFGPLGFGHSMSIGAWSLVISCGTQRRPALL